MMQQYLCVGLGVWLMAKIVDNANPLADLTFWQEVVNFLAVVLLWPLSLAGNYLHSRKLRKMEEDLMKEFMKETLHEMHNDLNEIILNDSPPDAPGCPESNKDTQDKG